MARSHFKERRSQEANSGIASRRAETEDGCRKELECKRKGERRGGRTEEKEEWKEAAEKENKQRKEGKEGKKKI